MYRSFEAWLSSASKQTPRKSMNISSTTGFRPVAAAPTAAPTNADSEIGVSRTRSAPNSSYRPRVTAKMPPELATSMPIMQTAGSTRISAAIPSRIASM
jgi:hypothetical protein